MYFSIHYYPDTVLGSSFVSELVEKLYKILHTLSVVIFQNADGNPIIQMEEFYEPSF